MGANDVPTDSKTRQLVVNLRLGTVLCALLLFVHTAQSHAQATPPLCPGDCNLNGRVAINELVLGVNIAVDLASLASCPLLDIDQGGTATIDEVVAAVAAALEGCGVPAVVSVDIDILGAAAPNTPGTPGVVVTNEKLITQFQGTRFNLNVPRYVRFRLDDPNLAPDAILVVVPAMSQGANHFRVLAENLINRLYLTHGFVLELWAFDRRSNQLEDRAGARLAEQLRDPLLALDWYYGSELGLSLDPRLTRRALFYNDSDDVPFLANWTPLIHSRDIDVVVEAARAAARDDNVFLGGFSGGAAFTARYAATNLNLSGAGPAEPGYEKLRGLVLLDGTGSPTAGSPIVPPPSDDDLDLVIAKADGGLFAAVRDGEPRCVNGSACEDDEDCAGVPLPDGALTNKCVEPTGAYTKLLDLEPSFFAAADVAAIQALTDSDAGQVILQVDQGAPGNNAIAKVPALSALGALPASTVEGLIGTFVDDDGPSATLTLGEIAFSLGAPGPVVGGLSTWRDITEGPPPPSAVPDRGPPPTAIPPPGMRARWGQEKEVIRMDRYLLTSLGVNGADWYYPTSGLSVSEGLGLDTTPLSVGRDRPDIENLTQAANIDIPVISFGGSNGLTPIPADYLDLAEIIGACAAPSCDSTPRVVDPDSPNPAFPTFGDVAGGFEVHISEGFAHGDVIFAEDGPDNNVLAPLAEFLVRNTQGGQ